MELDIAIQNTIRKLSSHGLDAYEVAGLCESALAVESMRQMEDTVQRTETRGVAIRIIKDGRMGFASTTDLSPRAIEQTVNQAVLLSRHVTPSEEATIPDPQDLKDGFAEKLGRSFAEIPNEEKVQKAKTLESAAIAFDSRISQVQHARYEERIWSLRIINSKGITVSSQRGLGFCELKAVAKNDSGTEGAYEFDFSPRFEELDAQAVAVRAAKRALAKLGSQPMAIGSVPVVFSPRSAASMLKLVAPSFFADNVQKGKSVISAKCGERIYSPKVSIIDDGLLPGGLLSFSFDGEGIPRRRNIMIENGTVSGWLYDSARARIDGTKSTGSAKRGDLRQMPQIDVSNCFLKAGGRSQDSILRGVARGFYVTDLSGTHTANTISGDFSLGAEGFLIENGVMGQPVRGVTVAGNVHELFARIVEIGNDPKFHGEYGSPTFLVEELTFAGG